MNKNDINKLEDYGCVADSIKIRNALIIDLDNGIKNLEVIQEELKKIIKTAKKKGLFTRAQLFKEIWTVEEAITIADKQKIIYNYSVLLKKLPNKNNNQKIKKI